MYSVYIYIYISRPLCCESHNRDIRGKKSKRGESKFHFYFLAYFDFLPF